MKKKPKQKLSPLQKRKLIKFVVTIVLLAFLWVFFSPNVGIWTVIQHRSELHQLQEETIQFEQENTVLQNEIDRLQNDPAYLEEIARKKYGLLKKNEQVFDFSKKKPEKNK
jgi:cell division protein FtsB